MLNTIFSLISLPVAGDRVSPLPFILLGIGILIIASLIIYNVVNRKK